MPDGGEIEVGVQARGRDVEVTFSDTGVGMDPDSVARAFEPFFSTKTRGSGLGLANARRNVELCGGRVALASVVGEGTTVTVTLPVDPPPAATESD
jgi:signal transduction histidine kinase